jgi:hypothetical protein
MLEYGLRFLARVAVSAFAALHALKASQACLAQRDEECHESNPRCSGRKSSRHHDNEICVVPCLCAQLVIR